MRNKFFLILSLFIMSFLASGWTLAQSNIDQIDIVGKGSNIVVSPDSKLVAIYDTYQLYAPDAEISSDMLAIRVYDIESNKQLWELTGMTDFTLSGVFTLDSKMLVTHHRNGFIYLWDMESGKLIRRLASMREGGQHILLLSDDKSLLVRAGDLLASYMLWDIDSGIVQSMLAYRFDNNKQQMELTEGMRIEQIGHYSTIAAALSPDSRRFVSVSQSGDIWLWDLSSPQENPVRIFEGDEQPTFPTRHIYFTPDGESLIFEYAYRKNDEKLGLYQLDLLSRRATLLKNSSAITVFALSPDGETLVIGDADTSTLYFAPLSNLEATVAVDLSEDGFTTRMWKNMWEPFIFIDEGARLVVSGFTDESLNTKFLKIVTVPE